MAEERRKLEEGIARVKEDRKKLETMQTTRFKPVDTSIMKTSSMTMHRVTQEEMRVPWQKGNSDREGLDGLQRSESSLQEEMQEPRPTWRNFLCC